MYAIFRLQYPTQPTQPPLLGMDTAIVEEPGVEHHITTFTAVCPISVSRRSLAFYPCDTLVIPSPILG